MALRSGKNRLWDYDHFSLDILSDTPGACRQRFLKSSDRSDRRISGSLP